MGVIRQIIGGMLSGASECIGALLGGLSDVFPAMMMTIVDEDEEADE